MESHRISQGEVKISTMEFETATEAAVWAVRFMTEMDDSVPFPNELHVVNLQEGVTLVIHRRKNDGVSS